MGAREVIVCVLADHLEVNQCQRQIVAQKVEEEKKVGKENQSSRTLILNLDLSIDGRRTYACVLAAMANHTNFPTQNDQLTIEGPSKTMYLNFRVGFELLSIGHWISFVPFVRLWQF